MGREARLAVADDVYGGSSRAWGVHHGASVREERLVLCVDYVAGPRPSKEGVVERPHRLAGALARTRADASAARVPVVALLASSCRLYDHFGDACWALRSATAVKECECLSPLAVRGSRARATVKCGNRLATVATPPICIGPAPAPRLRHIVVNPQQEALLGWL